MLEPESSGVQLAGRQVCAVRQGSVRTGTIATKCPLALGIAAGNASSGKLTAPEACRSVETVGGVERDSLSWQTDKGVGPNKGNQGLKLFTADRSGRLAEKRCTLMV